MNTEIHVGRMFYLISDMLHILIYIEWKNIISPKHVCFMCHNLTF